MDDFLSMTLRIAIVDADRVANGVGFLPVYVGNRKMGSVRIEKHGDSLTVSTTNPRQDHFIQIKRARSQKSYFICPKCRLPTKRLFLTHASHRHSPTVFECRACAHKSLESLKDRRLIA